MGNSTKKYSIVSSHTPNRDISNLDEALKISDFPGRSENANSSGTRIDSADGGRTNGNKKNKGTLESSTPCFSKRVTVYKNVLVLSLAFFLLFSAFQGLANLQTSIHGQQNVNKGEMKISANNQGLGPYSMSAMYAALVFSAIFLPQLVINVLTLKWTIVVCVSLYNGYIFANLNPSWFTLIPGAICVGLAAGALWTAQSTYLAEMGRRLANCQAAATSGDLSEGYLLKSLKEETFKKTPGNATNKLRNSNSTSLHNSSYTDLTATKFDEKGSVLYDQLNDTDDDHNDNEHSLNGTDNNTVFSEIGNNPRGSISKRHRVKNAKKRRVKLISEKTIPHLMGIFFCFFQGGQIFGNIVSSITLSGLPHLNSFATTSSFKSSALGESVRFRPNRHCGGRYCPQHSQDFYVVSNSNDAVAEGRPLGVTFRNNASEITPVGYNSLHQNLSYVGGKGLLNRTIQTSHNNNDDGYGENVEILDSKINMLCYIYAMMCMISALIVALFLDPVTLPPDYNRGMYQNHQLTDESFEDSSTQGKIMGFSYNPDLNQRSEVSQLLNQTSLSPVISSLSAISMGSPVAADGSFGYSSTRLQNLTKNKRVSEIKQKNNNNKYWYQISSTFRQLKNPLQLLLIPLTIYMGIQQGFMAADFTSAFVSCYYGIKLIGLVMSFYGLIDALCAIFGGSLNMIMPRYLIFLLILIVHGSTLPFLTFFGGFGSKFGNLLAAAALWAIGDGLLQPQLNGLYGALFDKRKETAAYANCRLWEAVGFIISFSVHEKLCLYYKTIMLGAFLTLGMTCYGLIEIFLFRKKQRLNRTNSLSNHPSISNQFT